MQPLGERVADKTTANERERGLGSEGEPSPSSCVFFYYYIERRVNSTHVKNRKYGAEKAIRLH